MEYSHFIKDDPVSIHGRSATFKYKILIHGGAWDIPESLRAPHREGVERALSHALSLADRLGMEYNGKVIEPLDIVAETLAVLEDDPTFDAGYGSFLSEDGKVEMDAAVMEGCNLEAGGVAGVSCFPHPGKLALQVLRHSPHVLIAGEGAERFGDQQGFKRVDPETLILARERENHDKWVADGKPDARVFFSSAEWVGEDGSKRGTVGVVLAVQHLLTPEEEASSVEHSSDSDETSATWKLYAGTSTGGIPGKVAGRVGDVPIVGSGLYADNEGAAVSCTGWGEGLMRVVAAKSVSDMVSMGIHPQAAVERTLSKLWTKTGGRGGIIAIDSAGRTGAAFSTPDMAFASRGDPCSHMVLGR